MAFASTHQDHLDVIAHKDLLDLVAKPTLTNVNLTHVKMKEVVLMIQELSVAFVCQVIIIMIV